jgi:hypothetical protein
MSTQRKKWSGSNDDGSHEDCAEGTEGAEGTDGAEGADGQARVSVRRLWEQHVLVEVTGQEVL